MSTELLSIEQIAAELPQFSIEYFDEIDSTSSYLMSKDEDIDGLLVLAEAQSGGRGRRSKVWLSPHARSLSMSFGFATSKQLNELGGLSCVVGIALCNVFRSLGIRQAELKWPNDLLVDGAKLCGILVELKRYGTKTIAVVGVGVNVDLSANEIEQIEQAVTDVRRHGVTESRTNLVIRLISEITQQLQRFENSGFGPFVGLFDALHCYQGKNCTVLHGESSFGGVVEGVDVDGALRLRGEDGVLSFHGGEVSLRPENKS